MAEVVLHVLAGYLALGVLVAVPFAAVGVQRTDPAAAGYGPARLVFRLMIVPGCVVLWPLVLKRWLAPGGEASS